MSGAASSSTSSVSPSTSSAPAKKKRTRTGCLSCRSRKVKCDESKGDDDSCNTCRRLNLPCLWNDYVPSRAKPGRPKQCDACRESKRKCDFQRPCMSCSSRMIDCTDGAATASTSTAEAAAPSWASVTKEQQRQMVAVYFAKVYHLSWHSYMHRSSFMHAFEQDTASPLVVKSVCVAASVFMQDQRRAARLWARELERDLGDTLSSPTIDSLIALVNLTVIDMANGNNAGMWSRAALAVRFVYLLGLNEEVQGLPRAQRETRRRLAWAVFCLDGHAAGRVAPFKTLPLSEMRVNLPLNEREYQLSLEVESGPLHLPYVAIHSTGIFAHTVTVFALRYDVLNYVGRHAREPLRPWMIGSGFESCRNDLLKFRASLPPELELTPDNILARRDTNQLNQLLTVHTTWALTCCDLYHIALLGSPDRMPDALLSEAPPEWMRATQEDCFDAARTIADLFSTVLDHDKDFGNDALTLTISCHECLRVHLMALAQLEPELRERAAAEAVPRLQVCLTLMRRSAMSFPFSSRHSAPILRLFKEKRWPHATIGRPLAADVTPGTSYSGVMMLARAQLRSAGHTIESRTVSRAQSPFEVAAPSPQASTAFDAFAPDAFAASPQLTADSLYAWHGSPNVATDSILSLLTDQSHDLNTLLPGWM